ncbi:MAG: hypothetical protein JHD02_04365 [Thermoleophilaceae bacterium]|nr:hypothetical protein [Thermoleophilaceae bacterium]
MTPATVSGFLAGPFGSAVVLLLLGMLIARECARVSGSQRAWALFSGRSAIAVGAVSAAAFWLVIAMRFVDF